MQKTIPRNNHFTVQAYRVLSLLLQWDSTSLQAWRVRGLSGKYLTILNILRTGQVAVMELGSHSEETLLCVREQSLSRGASQSAARRRWLSLCTVWPSHSQWPSEQISFIMTMCLPILQLSCRIFLAKHHINQVCQPPLQPRFGSRRLLAFPITKIAVEREEICEWDSHTVHNGVSLPTD